MAFLRNSTLKKDNIYTIEGLDREKINFSSFYDILGKIMKYHILLINLITFTLASTPFYYGFSNGYDNNVLRLSSSEVKEINSNMTFIDGIDKMDSYISKFGFKVDKTIYIQNKKEVLGKINASFSNFHQNEYKKYWSGGFDFIYKWGSYKNLKYSLRHLNNFLFETLYQSRYKYYTE